MKYDTLQEANFMITVCKKDIARGLTDIGLKQGDVVIVHTSLKSIGYVCGGAQAVIEALIETVTSEGKHQKRSPRKVCLRMGKTRKIHHIGTHPFKYIRRRVSCCKTI